MATARKPSVSRTYSGDGSNVILKTEEDADTQNFIHAVFDEGRYGDRTKDRKILSLSNLASHMDERMKEISDKYTSSGDQRGECVGIIHALDSVQFGHSPGTMGTVIIEADRIGVASHSNFSTIKASSCVYKGKWMYEAMLGSKGVMQIGWCTKECKFTQEEGVGDTRDSYAYDGNRIRKWNNKTPLKYGQLWLTGDVIGCAIDCDAGSISFYRNGEALGEAYNHLRLGPGMAYFPAVSLSMTENIRANFGATPFKYPIEGYQALQKIPVSECHQAQTQIADLEKLLPLLVQAAGAYSQMSKARSVPSPFSPEHTDSSLRSKKASLLLIASHVMEKLGPLLRISYVVDSCLLPFMSRCHHIDPDLITSLLHVFWALLMENELKLCFELLMMSLLTAYRFTPVNTDFLTQIAHIKLLHTVLQHIPTRKHLIKNVLFSKVRFPIFMHIKPPDDDGLAEIIPTVWWDKQPQDSLDQDSESPPPSPTKPLSLQEAQQQTDYHKSCTELGHRVGVLENLQTELLKMLMVNDDPGQDGHTTRYHFLIKFRTFLKENSGQQASHRPFLVNECPLPVALCFFHRLVKALRFYWNQHAEQHPGQAIHSNDAYVPCEKFYDGSIFYFDIQRLGGLISHLRKQFKDDPVTQWSPGSDSSDSSDFLLLSESDIVEKHRKPYTDSPAVPAADGSAGTSGGQEPCIPHSLVEILDGTIMLYNIAAHKQLTKMSQLRDTVQEYVKALEDTQKKLKECPTQLVDVRKELQHAADVFGEKTTEQSRHMAWVIAVIYSQTKQEDVLWLMRCILTTLQRASGPDNSNKYFSFVPDYYIEACVSTYNALRGYFHPTSPYTQLEGFQLATKDLASFLCRHFSDSRIVNAEIKDSIIQAMAMFVCYPMSLKALESIDVDSQLTLVRALLTPYENRSWAQTNWILVRIWKGCGFGFRYKHLPHLPMKLQQPEIGGSVSLQKPCPSPIFQRHLATVLQEDWSQATKLFDSLLNQCNWAFSEFIGMLQELQSIANRATATFIDHRQLKICATCFDISVGLLRVIEMIVTLVPELLTDWTKPNAELLLCRLYQSLTQILNRVTTKSNTFDMVVLAAIPGMETVDHYPVLTAVAGILVQLLVKAPTPKQQECAIAALLAEPGFQMPCLEFILGSDVPPIDGATSLPEGATSLDDSFGTNNPFVAKKKPFSIKSYEEVNAQERRELEELVSFIKSQQLRMHRQSSEIDEEELCNICYAQRKSVSFKPCGHESCKPCISHHLMNKKECFFCKTNVEEVVDLNLLQRGTAL